MGNEIAYAALAIWPIIAIRLYQTKTVQVATLWTILGGFMFLPVRTEVDLPLIPPLGKDSIPVLSALLGCWFVKKRSIRFFANRGLLKSLVFLFFAIPFITTELNSDRVFVSGWVLPGLTHHDALSLLLRQFLFIAPFFIGRRFFRTYEDQFTMFKVLVIAGLFYSLLMLFEIRMSPQLHKWIYGYFPHSFGQQRRFDGFRPMVFMGHGLWVSFFTVVVLSSSMVLWKNKAKISRFSPAIVSYYLIIVLVLCKSIASILYGALAFIVIKNSPKIQLRFAAILVILALLYPTMSILKIFPHQKIVEIAFSFDASRAQSIEFRFENEEALLEHARKRFFFGWGGWGRNRVYNEDTGVDETVTDGRWIITFGQLGWLGFIAEFGLLSMVVFLANIASKLIKSKKELALLAAHAFLVGLIMIDQLPNATLEPWLWLLAGILLGRSESIITQNRLEHQHGLSQK